MKTEIIQALLDGKTIQYNHYANDIWHDFNPSNIEENFTRCASLFTDDNKLPYQWRIKPQIQSYRLALIKNDKGSQVIAVNSNNINLAENLKAGGWIFVKWLTDWTDYGVD